MKNKLKRRNPKRNPDTGEVTYPFSIPGIDLVRNAKPQGVFVQNGNQEFETNLADEHGMNIALEILNHRWKNTSES
jgi:hypothetical protein